MDHINKIDFYRVYNVNQMKERNKKMYNRIFNRVLKEWESPDTWLNTEEKTIYIETRTSDRYWIAWSMIKQVPLPVSFINKIMLKDSNIILENTLQDYQLIKTSIEKMKSNFTDKYVDSIYSMLLKLCLFKGTNNFKEITISDVANAYNSGLLQGDGNRSRVSLLMYYAGYTDKYYNDSNLYSNLKELKSDVNQYWADVMKNHVNDFISDSKGSIFTSDKMSLEKIKGLNIFSEWYCNYANLESIYSLIDFTGDLWLKYIDYIKQNKNVEDKTKASYLRAIKDLYKWSFIKKKQIFNENLKISNDDYKNLMDSCSDENKAFKKREHGEKILRYLLNDFKSSNVGDLFRKEAIIIAANCGARIEEIRKIEYKSYYYSEDEEAYKIIINYPDKLYQEGVPLYLTKAGYDAIKRVEKLKEEYDVLEESYDARVDKSYIHLFEYRGRSSISRTSLYRFLDRIKIELGLLDENGNPIKGGMHSFRHFFGKTMFIESNYNIEVVRYLLRHKDYRMSFKYIQEEKELLQSIIQDEECCAYSGEGLDTIVDLILGNGNSEYNVIQKAIKNSSRLSDLIKNKAIKKVGFGYCLKPCSKKGCIGCRNFLLTRKESQEILNATLELFELICLKKYMFTESEKSSISTNLENDIQELIILIQEVKNLKLDYSVLTVDLKELIENV